MFKRTRLSRVDVVLLGISVAAVLYFLYRFDQVFLSTVHFGRMPQYFFRRSTETGQWVANFLTVGIVVTIKISIWSMIPATIIGIVFGLFRTSKSLFLRMVGRTYVEIVRNLPPLVLVYIFYFFFATQFMELFGVEDFIRGLTGPAAQIQGILFTDTKLFVPFLTGVLTLSFFVGAYITEIVRAGIESVETGQRQAAYSLGLSWRDEMRFIIIPQAIKVVAPALASEYINTVKYSSLLSVVSIQELTYMGRQVNLMSSDMFATWITVGALYFLLTFILSLLASRVEARMARSTA